VVDTMAVVRPDGPRGHLITVEGVEGAGKSTQTESLRAWLAGRAVSVLTTAEPDGTVLGANLRRLLGEIDRVGPLAEALLFAASRAEHVERVIRPALAAGQVVLCDRYVDSTVAYQGHGRGLPLELVAQLNRLATGGVMPDLTLVLDLDVAEGLRRARARRGALAACDPFERLALEFHERVRKGYWAIRDREPDRVILVDAHRAAAVVAAEVAGLVARRLGLEPP
jgi:dTMP kinase